MRTITYRFTGQMRPAEKGDWITSPNHEEWETIEAWLSWTDDMPSIKPYPIWERIEEKN